MIEWERWDKTLIKEAHGDIFFYRKIYEGEHSKLFPRAIRHVKDGSIVEDLKEAAQKGENYRHNKRNIPYIVANVSKLIPEIPAMLVSRAIGRVYPANDVDYSEDVQELQKVILEEIEEDSNLVFEHYTNILQHQIDGGLVGIVMKEEDDIPVIEMKARDVYFPHDDGRGADIALEEKYDKEEYLHIYRERIEREKKRDPKTKRRTSKLIVKHMLFKIEKGGKLEEVEEEEAKVMLGLEELVTEYPGRTRGFIEYWANNKTFNHPLGVSALKGQESKQDEINWTLTRNAIVFEQNGKPKIAINKKVMGRLRDIAFDKYGDENKIDAEDVEIFEMDDEGNTMEIYQIDISKIGNMEWIKDLMKIMFVETQTSEKAVDFYIDGTATGGAISGVAKFYDLFTSIIKAEKLAKEYVRFLQNLFESALWLERDLGDEPELPVEKPDIALLDMIPISRKELIEQEGMAFEKSIQSRYETVKRLKPHDSEESIEDEIVMIESESLSDNSTSLLTGRQTLQNLQDNRDEDLINDPAANEDETEG